MLKLNVDGAARPQTAGGNAGNGSSAQDWSEMECRMQYLEAQAEEAAAALAGGLFRTHTPPAFDLLLLQ
jgi:hypothetical protein